MSTNIEDGYWLRFGPAREPRGGKVAVHVRIERHEHGRTANVHAFTPASVEAKSRDRSLDKVVGQRLSPEAFGEAVARAKPTSMLADLANQMFGQLNRWAAPSAHDVMARVHRAWMDQLRENHERLVIDLDGGRVERVWGEPVKDSDGLYRVDTSPYLATTVALADVVRAERSDDGSLKVVEVVEHSGFGTLRAVVPDHAVHGLVSKWASAGAWVDANRMPEGNAVAIAVAAKPTAYKRITGELDELVGEGLAEYEVLVVPGKKTKSG